MYLEKTLKIYQIIYLRILLFLFVRTRSVRMEIFMLLSVLFALVIVLLIALFEKRFEWVFPTAILALIPLLTALGMLHALSSLSYVLGFILLLVLFLLFQKSKKQNMHNLCKQTLSNLFTPALIIFALTLLVFAYLTQARAIWGTDEVGHWALEPKLLLYYDGFAQGSAAGSASQYTPAITLFYWLAMHITGTWSEPYLFFTLFSLFTTLSLPLFSKVRWSKWWIIPACVLFNVLFPVLGNQSSYDYLSADTALAYCFAFCLMQLPSVSKKDSFALLSLCLGSIGLVMIKEFGLLFLLFLLVLYFVYGCHRQQKTWRSLCVFLLPLLCYGIWFAYCKWTGRMGYHSETTNLFVSQLLSGTFVMPEHANDIFPALWYSLVAPFERITETCLPLTRLFWLLIMPVVTVIMSFFFPSEKKLLRRLAFFSVLLSAIVVLIQYVAFLSVFSVELTSYTGASADRMIDLMQRYLAPACIGFFVFLLFVVISLPKNEKAQKICYAIMLASLCALILLSTHWTYFSDMVLPAQEELWASTMADEKYDIDPDQLALIEDPQNAKILTGYFFHSPNMTYFYAPYRFLTIQNIYSGTDLKNFIQDNQLTHLIIFGGEYSYNGNPSLYALVAEMYPYEPIELGFLYTIVWDGDEINLKLT